MFPPTQSSIDRRRKERYNDNSSYGSHSSFSPKRIVTHSSQENTQLLNEPRMSIDSKFSNTKLIYKKDKNEMNVDSKCSMKDCTLLLPVRSQSNPVSLRFTLPNQTLFLRLKNESQIALEVALISLPTSKGFSTREVRWNVPALDDELVPVSWKGSHQCKDFMVLRVGSSQIRVTLESGHSLIRSPLAPIRAPVSHMQSPSAILRTPISNDRVGSRRESLKPPSSVNSAMTSMTDVPGITGVSTSKKLKKFHLETKLIRKEQPSSRLEALQMELQRKKIQQKQWISALPIHIDDLREEIQRLKIEYSEKNSQIASSSIGTHALRSATHNTKLRLLKNWIQLIVTYFGIDPSRLDPSDDHVLYSILVNAYRTHPKDLKEVLKPDDYKRLTFEDLNDSVLEDSDEDTPYNPYDADTWMNRFQILIGLEEYETPSEEDKTRIIKLSKLCHKLVEKRRSVHLMNILLFVQNNIRRSITLLDQKCRENAALTIQKALRSQMSRLTNHHTHKLICYTQSALRCMIAQLQSELNRKRRFVVQLQAFARMTQVYHKTQQDIASILSTQSVLPRFPCQLQTRTYIRKINTLQNHIRRNLKTPVDVHRTNIIQLQSKLRGNGCEVHTKFLRLVIKWTQSNLRRFSNIISTSKKMEAIHTIQKCMRRGMIIPIDYQISDIIFTQSQLRSFTSALSFHREIFSIRQLQRKLLCHGPYQVVTGSIVTLKIAQSSMRTMFIQKKQDAERDFIILVQSKLRSNSSRFNLLFKIPPIMQVQSLIRTWNNHFEKLKTLSSIICIQSRIRMQIEITTYEKSYKTLIQTQSQLRSMKVVRIARDMLDDVHYSQNLIRTLNQIHRQRNEIQSLTRMQSIVRMNIALPVEKMIDSVIATQSFMRTILQANMIQNSKEAILLVQSRHRGIDTLSISWNILEAVQNLQRSLRERYASALLQNNTSSIIRTQSVMRTVLQLMNTQRAIGNVKVTQSTIRQELTAGLTSVCVQYITQLQAQTRRYQTCSFPQTREMICQIQTLLRTLSLSNQFLRAKQAIVKVQATLQSIFVRQNTLEAERRVRNFQRAARMMIVPAALKQSCGVVTMQCALRSNYQTEKCKREVRVLMDAQSILRTSHHCIARNKTLENVKYLQKNIRMQIVSAFSKDKSAIVAMQSRLRSTYAKLKFEEKHHAAVKIQATWKAFVSSCLRRYSIYLLVEVQSTIRRNIQSSAMCQIQNVNCVQSQLRRNAKIDQIRKTLQQIVPIQSCARMKNTVKNYEEKLQLVQNVQCIWRSRTICNAYELEKQRILSLQNVLRSYQTQESITLILNSVNSVQNTLRSTKSSSDSRALKSHIVLSQSRIKSLLEQISVNHKIEAIKSIQLQCCKLQCINRIDTARGTIIKLQSIIRGQLSIQNLEIVMNRVKFVQKTYKDNNQASIEKTNLHHSIDLVSRVQSWIRSMHQQHTVVKEVSHITAYQRYIVMKATTNQLRKTLQSIVLLQSHGKGMLAVSELLEDLSTYGREKRAATKIQRVFRGFYSRCRKYSTQQKELQVRLQRIKEEFEERRQIQKKTRKGLYILLNSKQMSSVMKACADLDNATTVSEKSCKSMCHEGALLQLMHLIKTCNRSEPHVKLLVHMLNILINVSKDVYRAEYVFDTKDCIDILVEQLQMYRDKPEVFLRAMKVLELLTIPNNTDNESSLQVQRMQKIKEMKGTVKRLYAVAGLLEGKYKLEKKFAETQRVQLSRQSTGRLSLGGNSSRLSIGGMKSHKQSPVILCYESLISFMKHMEGKVPIRAVDKPEDELTMEDRQLTRSVNRVSIRPSQALQLLNANDTFATPVDRRISLAPSARNTQRRQSVRPKSTSNE